MEKILLNDLTSLSLSLCVCERETGRGRERQRQGGREIDRERETETEREREREGKRETETDRQIGMWGGESMHVSRGQRNRSLSFICLILVRQGVLLSLELSGTQ